MLASARAGFAAAFVALFFSLTAFAADKPFQRSDLADSAVRLETQIKTESGQVAKPVAHIAQRGGSRFRASAISAPACRPWRRSSRSRRARPVTGCGSPAPSCRSAPPTSASGQTSSSAPRPPPISAISAPAMPARRPTRWCCSAAPSRNAKLWRPALDAYRHALDLREVAEVRQTYESLRDQHGFRILDYSVDADAASPRACFQFSEELPGKRTDFSPFVAQVGATTSRRSPRKTSSSASRGSSMASAIRSRCAPACRRP